MICDDDPVELAQALHAQRQLASIHHWIGVVYCTRYATRQARKHAERALIEAQELGDAALVAYADTVRSGIWAACSAKCRA
jgi:hypothetical protein